MVGTEALHLRSV